MVKGFSYLKNSMISVILCFLHKVSIPCVFKCQICKSGGESICTLMQTIFILHILNNDYICQYSTAKLPVPSLGRISSIPLILKRLAQIKILLCYSQPCLIGLVLQGLWKTGAPLNREQLQSWDIPTLLLKNYWLMVTDIDEKSHSTILWKERKTVLCRWKNV